jgi:hypothetical protein
MYSASYEDVAVTITQSSDAGDAQAEMLPILIHRGTATGSGGTSVTPSPLNLGDPAYSGTVNVNLGDTTHMSQYTSSAG